MSWWYAPDTNSAYRRSQKAADHHVEIPPSPPGHGWEWDSNNREWSKPVDRLEAEKSNEALRELADTDWRVIKAAEEYLAKQGEIDVELHSRRENLRSVASREEAREWREESVDPIQ